MKAGIEELKKLNWQPPETFVVRDADESTDIHGVLYKPVDFDPNRKYPVVQFIYPSPMFWEVQRGFDPGWLGSRAQAIAQMGFITFIIDARQVHQKLWAWGESLEQPFGSVHVADSVAAIEQLTENRPYMDRDRIGVFGPSYGGYYAIRALLTRSNVYDVAVAAAPITDMAAHMGNHYLFGPPKENRPAINAASNLHLADQLRGKLLLIHGTADTAVPISHTFRMADALIKADKPFDLLVMPDETHGTENIWSGYGIDAAMRYFVTYLQP